MYYRGTVRKVSGSLLWVEVPELVPGETFGPCQRLAAYSSPAAADPVLVADLDAGSQTPDLVVVGKIA